MAEDQENLILNCIHHLRTDEELLIDYSNSLVADVHEKDLVLYLQREFENEQLEYPINKLEFSSKAALWSAKVVYKAANLLLNREEEPKDLSIFFSLFDEKLTGGQILSVDLCLRFLPAILKQIKNADPSDPLIDLLELILKQWHYSAVGYFSKLEDFNFDEYWNDSCLLQLYVDRVIEKKSRVYLKVPELLAHIHGCIGIHAQTLWKEL